MDLCSSALAKLRTYVHNTLLSLYNALHLKTVLSQIDFVKDVHTPGQIWGERKMEWHSAMCGHGESTCHTGRPSKLNASVGSLPSPAWEHYASLSTIHLYLACLHRTSRQVRQSGMETTKNQPTKSKNGAYEIYGSIKQLLQVTTARTEHGTPMIPAPMQKKRNT